MTDPRLPVATTQRTMFLHHSLHPGDAALNGPFAYEIVGEVDPERLRAAAQQAVRASAALNMTFRTVGGEVVGYPNSARAYRVVLERLGDDPVANAEQVARHVARRADTPMPPYRWPLYEVRVWTGAGRVYLAVVASHLVFDAASLWLLFDLLQDRFGVTVELSKFRELATASQADRPRTVPELARRYLAEIQQVRKQGPYRLGGYSFGGTVALELALQLRAAGEPVTQLLLIDAAPAHSGRGWTERELCEQAAALLLSELGVDPATLPAEAAPASFAELVALARRPEWSSGTAQAYQRQLTIWLHNVNAAAGYRPEGVFDGETILFAATDPVPEHLRQLGVPAVNHTVWGRHLTRKPRVVPVPGDHFSIFRNPEQLAALATAVDAALAASTR